MAGYLKIARNMSRSVNLYNLSWVFIGFSIFGLANVLANLYMLRLDYSPSLIGQIQGAGQLAWAACALPASLLGIRFGMRKVLTIGTAIVGIAYILFLCAAYFPGKQQIPMTFIAFGLMNFGAALSLVCGLPYLSTITESGERNTAMALNSMMATGAGVLGNVLAGLLPKWMASATGSSLDQALPYRLSLALVPLALLLAAFIQSRLEVDHLPQVETRIGDSKVIPFGIFLFFGVVVFLQAAGEGGMRAFFNIYMDQDLGVSTATIGSVFGLASLASVLGAMAMPVLVSRLGTRGTFGLISLTAAALLVVMGAFHSVPAAVTSFISLGAVLSLAGAVRNILSQEIVKPFWRSATSGILILGIALGWGATAMLGGLVIRAVNYSGLMFLTAAISVLSAVLMFGYLALEKRRVVAAEVIVS
jgi:MFS family permease